ncbi:polyketide synthase [Leptolyngbya sp. Heron Island J]|uniref:type I polyketide synthase n=1 Tax=Leptolyngbya sp. Heron Island J TaxID=1385935 RepID=UPI0003B97F98|nr:type I polyketide synthase [Leptolyngbya sp. Heron Island J]ESA36653.1 polyketide synthase [Leptolyngbya sp. Heron Island J]
MSNSLKPNNPTSDRVFRALKEARSQLEAIEQARNEQVAIIGMAGRFPGADSLEEFWSLLVQGETGIRMLSEAELLAAGIPESTFKQPNYVPAYASFTDPTQFDARFFGYSPREAELLDPQHRVFLECAWTALEDAGYDSQQYNGTIGVYGGAALNNYVINLHSNPAVRDSTDPVQAVVSNVMGLMPTRVSYQLDLTGPSCGIQTGCSTALVAIHTACQSLLNHECDMALAGGVTVSNATPQGYTYQPNSIAAPDGMCRAFDARGQGTLFGNGVGLVVLKRFQAALLDGDHIYAIVKGSAINNDGADKAGLTAPSISGQAKVIQAALDQAGIAPNTVSYVEGHGTGTPLGDPIEVAALNKVFNYPETEQFRCALGSVKTNLGHLDAAAGVAGLIKTALALKHKVLPPSLNFETPNPNIDFDQGPFFVNHERIDWSSDNPRRAGVSSFGMGGTNAHVILEEAPMVVSRETASRPWQLVMLSAKTPTALDQIRHNLVAQLRADADLSLADVAYTLQVGRRAWPHRQVCLCQTTAEVTELLSNPDSPLQLSDTVEQPNRSIVFMFSGQGSQHVNMALDLYESEPVFRQSVDQCASILGDRFPLLAALYPPSLPHSHSAELTPKPTYPLSHTANAQPTLFAIEYALAKTYLSWGIQPQALIGHSLGEYVAACVAGVFSLEDALTLVLRRGQLMQHCTPGSMLSILQPAEVVRSHLPPNVEIAVINNPQTCVVSGPTGVIAELKNQLETQTIPCCLLETSHAFHSALMESALADFKQVLQQATFNSPNIDIISNVTGTWLTDTEATSPDYWMRHLRQAVLFSQGITELLTLNNPIFLELGPGHTLTQLVQQHASSKPSAENRVSVIQSLPHPRENKPDTVTLMTALGKLWLAGIVISWAKFYQFENRHRLPLPTYPFERESYWIPLAENTTTHQPTKPDQLTNEKTVDMADWFYLPSWRRLPITHQLFSKQLDECWVVFADNIELWQPLTNLVKEIIWVTPGLEFATTDNIYTLQPEQTTDYQQLIKTLPAPSQIIYGWGLSSNSVDTFQSLLYLTQALTLKDLTDLTLTVVTREVQPVIGGESLNPDQAQILGLCQVIPQEYPELCCRHIDLANLTVDLKAVTQELCQDYMLEHRLVAYRYGQRWVQTYEPLPLPEQSPTLLKQEGTYIIAGDLVDDFGMIYAQALVKNLKARLILIGRPGLPAVRDWEKWLDTHGANHSVSRLIRKLQSLGTAGKTFLWSSGDLTDAGWVEATVNQGITTFGEVTGVFHTDVMGDQASCAIAQLDPNGYQRICRTKVQGMQILQQTLANHPVDFYVLQSSLSTVVGGVGFAAYAAANSYLNALAHQQSSSTQWLSLNWDACELQETIESANSTLIASALSADDVWQTTRRALAQANCQQLVISPHDLQLRIKEAFTPSPHRQREPSGENGCIRSPRSHPPLCCLQK